MVEDQHPCAFQHHPQHCSIRIVTQGPRPGHTRLQAHHVSHHCLTLPGLLLLSSSQGQAISSVPSQARFLSVTKTRNPRCVLRTLERKSCSWAVGTNNPIHYCKGQPQACPGEITSASFPETTGPEPWHVPKGGKHACPDTSVCRLEAGATVVGGTQVQGALQRQAGTWMCHTPAPLLGSLLWRRFGRGCAAQHLQALPTEHTVVPQLTPSLPLLPAVQVS